MERLEAQNKGKKIKGEVNRKRKCMEWFCCSIVGEWRV